MRRILSTVALLGYATFAAAQSLTAAQEQQLQQLALQITPADIQAAVQKAYSDPLVVANPALIPYLNNATLIGKSLLQAAQDPNTNLNQEVINAVDVQDGANGSTVQVTGGTATLTFVNISKAEAANFQQTYADFNSDRNAAKAVGRIEDILQEDGQNSSVAILAILRNLFGTDLPVVPIESTEGTANEEEEEEEEEASATEGASNEEEEEEAESSTEGATGNTEEAASSTEGEAANTEESVGNTDEETASTEGTVGNTEGSVGNTEGAAEDTEEVVVVAPTKKCSKGRKLRANL